MQLLGLVAQYAANVWQSAEVGFGVVQAFVGRDADGEAVQDGIVVENFCAVSGDVLTQCAVGMVAVVVEDEVVRCRRRNGAGVVGR